MNYFSHYYFDHRSNDALHNFGLVLPDFVRNFVKGHKLKPEHTEIVTHENHISLKEGTKKHFHRDHVFHNSESFKQLEHELNTILKPTFQKLDIPRYWFASHLLSEMMIDRVLMAQHPGMLDDFYAQLLAADMDIVSTYISACGVKDIAAFTERVNRFNTSQFLRQYAKDEALIYSLNRIYIYAAAGVEWSKEQYTELQKHVPEIENRIFESMDGLKQEMV
ncbi:MAG: hypothetical protein IT244_01365 [Bacteroidia bacterium]|nr:hypothetical protein [Bacteroidia bacterium]